MCIDYLDNICKVFKLIFLLVHTVRLLTMCNFGFLKVQNSFKIKNISKTIKYLIILWK